MCVEDIIIKIIIKTGTGWGARNANYFLAATRMLRQDNCPKVMANAVATAAAAAVIVAAKCPKPTSVIIITSNRATDLIFKFHRSVFSFRYFFVAFNFPFFFIFAYICISFPTNVCVRVLVTF